jgi:hypothetical protein
MLKIILLTLSLHCSFLLIAQHHSISGKIFSKSLQKPLAYSTVSLIKNEDSSVLFVTVSDTTGRFSIPLLASGHLTLSVSYVGYAPLWKDIMVSKHQSLDVDSLLLKEISTLDSVLVMAKRPPVELYNDTIQFNTENYKTPPNAVVEDMLKRMPGVTVDQEGNVRFNGKIVRNVLVNGKLFFTGNPKMATQNLNADWLDKVQVYEKKSERSAFTGMDDGQTETTMNLVLKKDKLKAVFGRTSMAGGTQERLDGQATINRFNTDQQLSFIGMANNTNKRGFALTDMLSFNQSLLSSGSTMINAGDVGLPVSDMGNQQQGIANTYAGGLNINESWKKKTDLNASLQLSNIQLHTAKNSLRNNLFPGNNFTYSSESENNQSTQQQRFNASIDQKIDSFHSIRITPQLSLQKEALNAYNTFKSYTTDNQLLNNGFTDRNNITDRLMFKNNILFRKRFRKKGRTFSSNVMVGYNEDKSSGNLRTENRFFTLGVPSSDSIFNQRNKLNVLSNLFNGSITFTEQLGKRTLMELTGYYNSSKGSSDRQTLNYNPQNGKFDIANTGLTNMFSMNQDATGGTIRFRSNIKKIHTGFAASMQQSSLTSENKSVGNTLHQSFNDVLPSADLRFTISSKTNLYLTYSTNTQMPSATQLQPVADIADPLNIYQGNPDLKRSYIQSLSAQFTHINIPKRSNLFMMASVNQTDNAIVQSDLIAKTGQRITTPVNTDGAVNALVNINASMGLRRLLSTVNLGIGMNYNESPTFINGYKNKLTNQSFNTSLSWNFALDNKLLVYASAKWNWSKAVYTLQPAFNNTFLQKAFTLEMTNYFPGNINLINNLTYTINSGRAAGFNTSIPYWTASISKSFLKNKRGEVKLTAYDVLSQNVGISRVANQQYVEDSRFNVLSRYFMFSFLYILNKSGKNTGAIFLPNR